MFLQLSRVHLKAKIQSIGFNACTYTNLPLRKPQDITRLCEWINEKIDLCRQCIKNWYKDFLSSEKFCFFKEIAIQKLLLKIVQKTILTYLLTLEKILSFIAKQNFHFQGTIFARKYINGHHVDTKDIWVCKPIRFW